MANIDDIHKHIANRQVAFVYHKGKYVRKPRVRVGPVNNSNIWIPKEGMAPIPAKTAFRHIRRRGYDRRIGIFQFRITRDDGTLIDHTSLYGRYSGISLFEEKPGGGGFVLIGEAHKYDPVGYPDEIPFWNKEGDTWKYRRDKYEGLPVEFSYNTVSGIWTIPYYKWGDEWYSVRKGKKFYAYFQCEDSVPCYYKISPSDSPEYFYNAKDIIVSEILIRPRLYEVRVPYYTEKHSSTRVPSPDFPDTGYGTACGPPGTHTYGYCSAAKSQALITTVNSSIPYTVQYSTDGVPTAFYHGSYTHYDDTRTIEECEAAATENWYQADWYVEGEEEFFYTPGASYASPVEGTYGKVYIPSWVKVTTSKGDVSNNIVTNPVDSEEIITPTPYVVEARTYRIDAFYTGYDVYGLPRVCSDGTVYFPLTFEIFRLVYSIQAVPNII